MESLYKETNVHRKYVLCNVSS